ncbi:MAG: hypothetical protein JSV86_05525 [Gemmatimonadota bacterium]|nr:MAG: hypothetical protein JSV86_05525 [Gemmatimonadota bacterium]
MTELYRAMALCLTAYENCLKQNNNTWADEHLSRLDHLLTNFMPSGSGFDSGTGIDMDESSGEKLVFTTSYHHMDDVGYYVGWSDHKVIVTPSLTYGINVRVTGKGRNQIEDYVGDVFRECLTQQLDPAQLA